MLGRSNSGNPVNKETIIISKDGTLGKIQVIPKNSVFTSTLEAIHITDNIDVYYLAYFLSTIDFIKFKVGTAVPHIYFKDYNQLIISYPTIKEQQKISKLIQLLDKHIDLKQKQLEKYKNIKEALINKMYCS